MGVYLHKNSPKWQIAFQYKGQKYSFSSGTTSRREAEVLEVEKREQVAREVAARDASGPTVTFNQAMGKYWTLKVYDPRPREEKSPERIEREIEYWGYLNFVGDFVGLDTPCPAVDTTRMIEIRDRIRMAPTDTTSGRLKDGTVNKRMQVVFAVLNVAKNHMRCPLPDRPRMKEVYLPVDDREVIIDYDDEEKICAHLPEACHAPFAFELETAIRRGDVTGLTWDRVDLAKGSIMAHRKNRGRKLYPVPLNKRARQILSDMKGLHPEYVFTRPVETVRTVDGLPQAVTVRVPFKQRHFSKLMKKAFRAAGLAHVRFHDLRRTAATRYYLATQDYEATRIFLGHGSIEMTKRYIKVALANVAAGVHRMDKARRGRGWKLPTPAVRAPTKPAAGSLAA
ncbi:site-specific integrase [Bradyrhizobium sp.]|uniref:site-specific integrase n=1 Tax=Bradyrhizobium sp. TaxID=376 RepID=UPI002639F46A|nr:site-specific integrase [Bradyrhizobium sp.]